MEDGGNKMPWRKHRHIKYEQKYKSIVIKLVQYTKICKNIFIFMS